MLTEELRWLPLAFCLLCVTAYGPEMNWKPAIRSSEFADGESHIYKFRLPQGQFARFRLEQQAIEAALILSAPDGNNWSR